MVSVKIKVNNIPVSGKLGDAHQGNTDLRQKMNDIKYSQVLYFDKKNSEKLPDCGENPRIMVKGKRFDGKVLTHGRKEKKIQLSKRLGEKLSMYEVRQLAEKGG